MNKLIYLVIIVILVFVFLQIRFQNKTNNDYDILQSNNPDKETFEKIVNQKSPSIFTNVINEDSKLRVEKLQKDPKSFNKLINSELNYYLIPMAVSYNYKIVKEDDKTKNKLIKETSSRHLIFQLKGTQKIILFNPAQSQYLYPNKNESKIDYWNQNLKKFPLINKAQFIEIILREGQLMYIPKKWWYTTKSTENTTHISSKSESIFSLFS